MVSLRGMCLIVAIALSIVSIGGCDKKEPTGANAPPPPGQQLNLERHGAGGAVMNVAAGGHKLLDRTDLDQLGKLYMAEVAGSSNGRGPASLAAWTELRRDLPKVYEAIQVGDIVIFWNVNPSQVPAGSSNTVLAYIKNVPTEGGAVLFCDGRADKVQPEEFKKLAMAGKP